MHAKGKNYSLRLIFRGIRTSIQNEYKEKIDFCVVVFAKTTTFAGRSSFSIKGLVVQRIE